MGWAAPVLSSTIAILRPHLRDLGERFAVNRFRSRGQVLPARERSGELRKAGAILVGEKQHVRQHPALGVKHSGLVLLVVKR